VVLPLPPRYGDCAGGTTATHRGALAHRRERAASSPASNTFADHNFSIPSLSQADNSVAYCSTSALFVACPIACACACVCACHLCRIKHSPPELIPIEANAAHPSINHQPSRLDASRCEAQRAKQVCATSQARLSLPCCILRSRPSASLCNLSFSLPPTNPPSPRTLNTAVVPYHARSTPRAVALSRTRRDLHPPRPRF